MNTFNKKIWLKAVTIVILQGFLLSNITPPLSSNHLRMQSLSGRYTKTAAQQHLSTITQRLREEAGKLIDKIKNREGDIAKHAADLDLLLSNPSSLPYNSLTGTITAIILTSETIDVLIDALEQVDSSEQKIWLISVLQNELNRNSQRSRKKPLLSSLQFNALMRIIKKEAAMNRFLLRSKFVKILMAVFFDYNFYSHPDKIIKNIIIGIEQTENADAIDLFAEVLNNLMKMSTAQDVKLTISQFYILIDAAHKSENFNANSALFRALKRAVLNSPDFAAYIVTEIKNAKNNRTKEAFAELLKQVLDQDENIKLSPEKAGILVEEIGNAGTDTSLISTLAGALYWVLHNNTDIQLNYSQLNILLSTIEGENNNVAIRPIIENALTPALLNNPSLIKPTIEILWNKDEIPEAYLVLLLKNILRAEPKLIYEMASAVSEKEFPLKELLRKKVFPSMLQSSEKEGFERFLEVSEIFKPSLYEYKERLKRNLHLLDYAIVNILMTEDYLVFDRFIGSESNETMLIEKSKLTKYLLWHKSDIIFNSILQYLESVKHSEKLSTVRGINNILSNGGMEQSDTLEDWRILLKRYIGDFGFLADRNLILVHRYLLQNKDIKGERLSKYALDKLGITSTGEEGIQQLKESISDIMDEITVHNNIKEEYLNNPVTKALIGSLTGFYSGSWGHGSSRGMDLADFVKQFHANEDTIIPLDKRLESITGNFSVNRTGKIDFTADETDMFSRYMALFSAAYEAVSERSHTEILRDIKDETIEVVQKERKNLEGKLSLMPNEKAKKGIAMRIEKLTVATESINTAGSLIELNVSLLKNAENIVRNNPDLQEYVILSLFIETFLQYPQLKEEIREAAELNADISLFMIDKLINLKRIFLKEHILADIDKTDAKRILKVFKTRIFEEARSRIEKTEESAAVTAVITKDILGELAGSIGDACYTSQSEIMHYPSMVGAVIFSQGEGSDRDLIGSMLILENSANGEKVWILRAINPQEGFISQYSTQDFLKGALDYVERLAKTAGVRYVVAPAGNQGSLSNRNSVNSGMSNFTEDFITLDKPEGFNGYDIQNTCKIVLSIDPHPAVPQQPVSEDILHSI